MQGNCFPGRSFFLTAKISGNIIHICYEVWLSLAERCVRDAKAAGSNPVTSTTKKPAVFFCGFFLFFYSPRPKFFLTLFMVLSAMASAFSAPSFRESMSS